MVLEANRDAARECVLRAREAMAQNDMEKMRRLLQKAKKLDPDCDVKCRLLRCACRSSLKYSRQISFSASRKRQSTVYGW